MRLKFGVLALFFSGLMLVVALHFGDVIWPDMALVDAEEPAESKFRIVIDPGHGGFDGGAVSDDGICEKDINLAIGLLLREIMEEYPIEIVLTRDSDDALGASKQEDLKLRESIIKESGADLTISIHLNSYPDDALVYGAQVFYTKGEQKRTAEDSCEQESKTYAENVQKALETNIDDGRTRLAMAKGDTYLLRNIETPYILVECGFLSNADEADKLQKAEYQRLLAESIWEGINTSLGLKKEQKIQIIQSTNKG